MAAFRFYNPAPVFESLLGVENLPGGSLTFFERGTTTPQDTYSDYELTTPNANPVALDGSGRANTNIWMDGEYTVILKDALGAVVWTRDVAPEVGQALTIPALAPGFLTNDGVNLLWQTVREMPDPTGSTNQVPVTDGAGYVLTNMPTDPDIPDPETEVGADFYRSGVSTDPTKFLLQSGTGTAPATGLLNSSVGITFDTPFDSLWAVMVTPMTAGVSSLTPPGLPAWGVTGYTAGSASSGVTVNFRIATDSGDGSSNNINNPVPFAWVAFGTVEIEPAP